jgi:small subunit ribosomal protein S6
MNKYEAMFIIKPDLSQEERSSLFSQLSDAVVKNQGTVQAGSVWAEKRKLFFPINKSHEGLYYLLNFSVEPSRIKEMRHTYKLNENILRLLITKVE